MYCAECGTANPIGAETCEVCGSPLGASSGDMNCHVCGAPVEEHDRFCRACGQSQSGAAAGRFEPGPSFVDDSALQVDPTELPPWLRDMTVSASQNGNGHETIHAPASDASDNLPPWLDSAPPANGTGRGAPQMSQPSWSAPAQPHVESAETFSLISEDDLPEWLRALGDQEFETEQPPIQTASPISASPQPVATIAPTVSRAWLSRSRDIEPQPEEEDVAGDFEPLESGPTAGLKRKTAPQTDELSPLDVDESVQPMNREPDQEPSKSNPARVRVLMFSIVVLLVVVLGYFAISNFL
ncbi:MAG: zinc ribbon domain-containing protein [Nitrolancea sp.]